MKEIHEFKILSKIKGIIDYSNKYVLTSIPKTHSQIRHNYENYLFCLLEEALRANVNKGNIRCKSIKEIIVYSQLIDYSLGVVYSENIIKISRFTKISKMNNELVRMSEG